jgi:murein DD-endopeptidase MepM/ murein hydrolase activator NlpD
MMNELITILKANQQTFTRVVPFSPGKDKLLLLDFTAANKELNEEVINNTRTFCSYINTTLEKESARYGIGGYNEYREIYSRSKVFDAKIASEEPRRLHLGTDIWGKPATAVIAPLDGIVHSFAFNNNPGDYGTTIILTHQLRGHSFYTLYGHLGLRSIQNLSEGDRISKGDIFAELGIPVENGQWPPHLHFQVINDLQGWSGDYPGVCKYSEKESYLINCPDPDLILQMNQFV